MFLVSVDINIIIIFTTTFIRSNLIYFIVIYLKHECIIYDEKDHIIIKIQCLDSFNTLYLLFIIFRDSTLLHYTHI